MSPAAVIALVGLALIVAGHMLIIGRWTGRLQTLIERHDQDIAGLREWKHHELPPVIAELQHDVIELQVRQEIQPGGRRRTDPEERHP